MLGIVGEAGTNTFVTFSGRLIHMNTAVLADHKRYQLCVDARCSIEDLPGVMGNRDR